MPICYAMGPIHLKSIAKIDAKNVKWLFSYNYLSSFNNNNRRVNVGLPDFNKNLLFFIPLAGGRPFF